MTFNEGMQIDTSTTSSSGGGGRGIAIGGGLAGLVVMVVALLLGADPGDVLSQQPVDSGQYSAPGFDLNKCRTGADANKYVECRVVATGNSVDAVWSDLMRGYTRPAVKQFKGQVQTGCGSATSAVGPFYCPVDRTAYFDTDFFQVLVDRFGSSSGPLAQEYVVAHEFGHHVQNLRGVLGHAQQGAQGSGGNGVRTELQADCYAGVWARRPHPGTVHRPRQPGVLDARLIRTAPALVHRRLPDRRPEPVRHLRRARPRLKRATPRAATASAPHGRPRRAAAGEGAADRPVPRAAPGPP